jgi:3,2-trans-enoyl-CoA isomerase
VKYVSLVREGIVATVTIARGKVNALNEELVIELTETFGTLAADESVRAVIITGQGKFFSFGLDVPEFMHYSRADFTRYVTRFAELYTDLFLFPKPVVAALNGHTVGGGCLLAAACDVRLMVSGKAKTSLNEITIGSTVFVGGVEMLAYWVGRKNAQHVLFSGALFSAEEAQAIGLIDQVTSEADLPSEAARVAADLVSRAPRAFASIKMLLRKPVVDAFKPREGEAVEEFMDIWYSESTQEQLKDILIRG